MDAHELLEGVTLAIGNTYAENQLAVFLSALTSKSNKIIENTKVIEILKRILAFDEINFRLEMPIGKELFRSRVINKEEHWKEIFEDVPYEALDDPNIILHGFDCYSSKEPPLGISKDGRNSIGGMSYLYLAEDEYTACAEVRPTNMSMLSLATFRVMRPLTLINFAYDSDTASLRQNEKEKYYLAKLITNIMQKFRTPVDDESAYYPTQYLADFIRKYGYDGLCYRSSISNMLNYTIFNCCEANIKFINSKIIRCQTAIYDLYDLNHYQKISVPIDTEKDLKSILKNTKQNLLKEICRTRTVQSSTHHK